VKTKIVLLVAAVVVGAAGIGLWVALRPDGESSSKDKKGSKPNTVSIELNISTDSLLLAKEHKKLQISIRSDNYDDIARVEYLLDGSLATYSTTAPFTVEIDLSGLSPGEHTLQAVAYTFGGAAIKSEIFRFIVSEDAPVEAANSTSENIVHHSVSKITTPSSGSSASGGSDNSGDGGPVDTTPWPDSPPALVCGNTAVLSGLSSAPQGATVVSSGNNNGTDFELPNTTYWFAPGTHTIGTDPLSQIEPGDNSTFIGAPGAIIDGQNINRHLFSQHAVNVKIQYLTIQNFATNQNEGNVNHDSGEGWTIEYNTIQDNGGAGVFGGIDNVIRYNCLKDNGQYGLQVFQNDPPGPDNVLVDHNEIVGNNQDDWETQQPGCGCTGGGKFWDADNVTITNNYVHDNLSVGLWADTNDNDFVVAGNYIEGNEGQGLFYEISYNMTVKGNNFIGNGLVGGPNSPGFPTGAIYLSEAGGDSRVAARTPYIEIYDNQFVDNWSGIILWENADRFCGSPNNTSTGTCTLVNTAVANLTTCKDPGAGGQIDNPPYYSDCRWKTQNVRVHNNVFSIDKSNIPQCTSFPNTCGFQGLFSNVGTDPPWSPYMGDVIQQDITFNQNNLFYDNTYIGDWAFKTKSQSTLYNFAIWQNPPFSQDTGSLFNGQDHYRVTNALDSDTATLEGGLGKWTAWFSSSISHSSAEAHSGSFSMKVNITAPFGWGVNFTDPLGFPVTPLSKTISFWAKAGSGTGLGATLEAQWLDANGGAISSVQVPLPTLTSSWQQASLTVTPPANVASVNLMFTDDDGDNGDSLYIDDIVVADP
jgi:hypothetical protein